VSDEKESRAGKVAVVDEVRERLSSTEAVVLTEYRGLDVPALAELRRALRDAGGEYKIYKNTLVRFAVQELGLDLEDLLVGPTAMAFVGEREDGTAGDPVSVARALREFAKDHADLLIKGGLLEGKRLSSERSTPWRRSPRARSCWPIWREPLRPRCSSSPASCRRCRRTWPTP
jgi:large subunit ribosomal protein L10